LVIDFDQNIHHQSSPFKKVTLMITVVDYDKLGSNDAIGRIYLGCSGSGAELRHWMVSSFLVSSHYYKS
jgi:hypothetical protein